MKKSEKIGIGTLILVSIVTIGVLVINKTTIEQESRNITKQPTGDAIVNDRNNKEQEDYSLEQAIENGYFVITHNKVYNKNKLDKFIENTSINSKNRIEDSIKIVQYTTEGDPIVTELSYKVKDETYVNNGKTENKTTYILKIDNTRDKWSTEEDRKIIVNNDIPGNIYGITENKDENMINVDLSLYAEIEYIDENVKQYETINICSYPSDVEQESNLSFYGKVIESNQNYILVEPSENEEIRKTADKIEVGLGQNNDALYKVGTNVKITYKGYVMESYPAKVDATNIEIKSADNFELRFYDKQPQSDIKIQKILDKSETEKYNYNIYTYGGSANILINGTELSLRDALLNDKITMEEIISKANNDLKNEKIKGDMYRDGGSMMYKYDNYTIIKFHKLDGKRDVYIGTTDMTINYIENNLES